MKMELSWLEVARLLSDAPHATREAEVLLDRYDAGEFTAAELLGTLRALATKHWSNFFSCKEIAEPNLKPRSFNRASREVLMGVRPVP